MNFKRISAGAIVLALALIVGVTAAFATSAADQSAEPEAVLTESVIFDASADDLADAEQELADAKQILADKEQEIADLEQKAIQDMAILEQKLTQEIEELLADEYNETLPGLALRAPELVAIEIYYGESVTNNEDGETITSPVELRTIYIPFEDTIGEMGETDEPRSCIALVLLPDGDSRGLGAPTVGVLKHMVLEYLDGKVIEGVITQDEAETIFEKSMQSVTFKSYED